MNMYIYGYLRKFRGKNIHLNRETQKKKQFELLDNIY